MGNEEVVLHLSKPKKLSSPNLVSWKLKMTIVFVTTVCFLPMGNAGGNHAEPEVDDHGQTICDREAEGECFNKAVSLKLKIAAIFAIFVASLAGVTLPLVGRHWSFLRPDSKALFVAKAFGAGVILATGFIHMLPESNEKLESECLPEKPWHEFPWASFFAMLTILLMNVIEFIAISYYESRAKKQIKHNVKAVASEGTEVHPATPSVTVEDVEKNTLYQNATTHGLSSLPPKQQEVGNWYSMGGHVHGVPNESQEQGLNKIRSVVVAQVLEFGIASHSILIGLAIGVSFSPCDIRPLLAALTFHQFFEGIALGGCITQAGFRKLSSAVMALVFASTTPTGICIGLAISNTYNALSTTALLTEGILDSISAGILIYMALVNLIANDFFTVRLRSDRQLQILAFIALFLGAASLSIIGLWA